MKRKGMSLLETSVYIAVSGVILTLAASFLAAMLRAESGTRRRAADLGASARLDRQFRTDVHSAQRASTPADVPGQQEMLRLYSSDDQLIEYFTERGELWRKVRRGQQTLHSDRFAFAAGRIARSENRTVENRPFVTLELQPATGSRVWTAPFLAVAELNRAARLSIAGARP